MCRSCIVLQYLFRQLSRLRLKLEVERVFARAVLFPFQTDKNHRSGQFLS